MKILYYNWIQFDNKENIGGGVNVYQKNIISELIKDQNNEIYFISSGWKYNAFLPYAYLKTTFNVFEPRCKSFEIINSPIMAPAFFVHKNLRSYLNNQTTFKIFKNFIKKYGPFDVIHLNNIEGISINILKLKKLYPNTKFIFSVHNYQPICPLVQYFNNQTNKICFDYCNGEKCINCSTRKLSKKELYRRSNNYIAELFPWVSKTIIFRFLTLINKLLSVMQYRKYYGLSKNNRAEIFKQYRESNIEIINKYCDYVLAVSNRVNEIMANHGISREKLFTSYIGTKFADNEVFHSIASKESIFTIAYLGFERIDKGYFFLIEALSKLPDEYKKKINIVLGVANFNPENIKGKLDKFNNIKIYKGYSHDELPIILKDVHLGIIPVLWEDNLPQVAIEMVACGVPILCSSFGGASELCESELFKFSGGVIDELNDKLKLFVDNKNLLDIYWENHSSLTTMDKHINELNKFYKGIFNE